MSARTDESVAMPSRPRAGRASLTARDPATATVEELFCRYEQSIGRFLVQMVRDRGLAEDLLQDTFHDALRSRSQLLAAPSPDAWLFAIARNRALSALRRRRRFGAALARLAHVRARSERSGEDLVALRDLLERHLAPDERALLLLRYLHGFDAVELAEISGLTPEAIRQRLSRSRRKLIAASEQPRLPGEDT